MDQKLLGPPKPFDLIQETIGPFGKWQMCVWTLTTLTNLPSAWHQVIFIQKKKTFARNFI